MIHEDLTHKIIGACMEVHATIGQGFKEVIYQRALAIELESLGLGYEREREVSVYYRSKVIGKCRVDFLVEGCVMVELKALKALEDGHIAQAKNYLETFKMKIGLLINFGSQSLEFKRIYNNNILSSI